MAGGNADDRDSLAMTRIPAGAPTAVVSAGVLRSSCIIVAAAGLGSDTAGSDGMAFTAAEVLEIADGFGGEDAADTLLKGSFRNAFET